MTNETTIKFKDIRDNKEINTYISEADSSLKAMGYTDHSFGHVLRCAKIVKQILTALGYSSREVELGQIAAYMHDIGNVVNRIDHAQSGAIMAFRILDKMGMKVKDVAYIVSAIGNHDESTAYPVNAIAAALILADKTDVRRSRVRSLDHSSIHNRVNYAVTESDVIINKKERSITLNLVVDTEICDVMDYFSIFMGRMALCKQAAKFLNIRFKLVINGLEII